MDIFKKIFSYIVGVVAATFGIKFNDGTIDQYILMFIAIGFVALADLIFTSINLIIKKKWDINSSATQLPLIKMFAALGIFLVLSISAVLSSGYYKGFSEALHWLTLASTIVIIISGIFSILKAAEDMGFKTAKKIMELSEYLWKFITPKK